MSMSMSNSASGLRARGGTAVAPSMSASAIVAKAASSGSHVLKIDGYSRTVGLGIGLFITSRSFEVGGHRWCLRYYPDSYDPIYYAGSISILLCLDPSEAGEVRAQYEISLLDQEGQPVPGCVKGSNRCSTFSAQPVPHGSCRYISKAVLQNPLYLKDDAFCVRCDINVVMSISTEDVVLPVVGRGIKKESNCV